MQIESGKDGTREGAATVLSYLLASLNSGDTAWKPEDDAFVCNTKKTMLRELRADKKWRKWFREFAHIPEIRELKLGTGLRSRE